MKVETRPSYKIPAILSLMGVPFVAVPVAAVVVVVVAAAVVVVVVAAAVVVTVVN